jgi:hypothetical protein
MWPAAPRNAGDHDLLPTCTRQPATQFSHFPDALQWALFCTRSAIPQCLATDSLLDDVFSINDWLQGPQHAYAAQL